MSYTNSQTDSADVSVRAISVQHSGEERSLLTVRYELAMTCRVDQRPLIVDFSECPLWPISLNGSDVDALEFDESDSTPLERVSVHLRSNATPRESSEVTVRLKWKNIAPHPALLGHSYLYLPADLPRIGKRENIGLEVSPQPVLRVHGDFERKLVGAQSYTLDNVVNNDGPLLRGVLARNSSIGFDDERDTAQLRLVSSVASDLSTTNRQQIRSTIIQMCSFFSDRLRAQPGLRIAAAVDSGSNARSVSGPLIAQSLDRFRLPELDQTGNEFPIAREIAANWWGTGVRIEGLEGIYLSGGIAFALGLHWAQSHAPTNSFDVLLKYYAERMVDSARFKHIEFQPGERTAGIGMVVYEALAREPKLWTVLQQLTAEFWSCSVPDNVVLESLGKGGFPIKEFTGKRFLRADRV
jgi:hypothetical protein